MAAQITTERFEERILIVAPLRRDAAAVAGILAANAFCVEICRDIAILCDALQEGAGAILIAEEALAGASALAMVLSRLSAQPAWSELPLILVTAPRTQVQRSRNQFAKLAELGSVIILERPLRSSTLVSAIRTALRARRRQYQIRDYLRERALVEKRLRAQEQELRLLNEVLEERVQQRTAQLATTNQRLVAEIEQREEAERAFLQAQKMEAIGRLTGGIAHDFNNLLMVISGGLTMIERGTNPERRERMLEGMRKATQRAEGLTRQLLAFSRHTALRPEPIDLSSQLEGMRVLITGALREDIALDLNIPDGLWTIFADAAQLELAVLNIAVNARDAMPSGGRLTITAANRHRADGREPKGRFVEIEFRDTGVGIPPEAMDRIFDPFFTTKAVGKGTGLGLSQVYGFAKQSGGHAAVRSRVREGTSIILSLPLTETAPSSVADGKPAEKLQSDGRGRRVLLVEDSHEVAMVATEMLEGLGFEVCRTASAPEALKLLRDGLDVSLVFSDIVMPGGMSGLDLAYEVKRSLPHLPVLLTTGYSETLKDGEALNDMPLLAKPYSLHSLEAALVAVGISRN